MRTKSNKIRSFVLMCLILVTWPKIWASGYEELTYDDLVNQLSEKKERANSLSQRKPIDQQFLGLGIVTSLNSISAGGKNYSINLQGYELGYGTNLNSSAVRGELGFRYFFERQNREEKANLLEIGANLQYRSPLSIPWKSKFLGGFAMRNLNFASGRDNVSTSDSSAMLMAGAGIERQLGQTAALSGLLSTRFPFGNSTGDRNSIEASVRLDTSF